MSYDPPRKNEAYIFYVGLISQATGQLQANPTLAAADWNVSIDGGAFNPLGTTPSVVPALGRSVKVTLAAGEMNGDNIVVVGVDAAGAEWDDIFVSIQPSNSFNSDDTVKADLKEIDGLATNGNNATLNLKQLNIVNNAGTALIAQSIGGNGWGARIEGNGTGIGLVVTGGANGRGMIVESVWNSFENALNILGSAGGVFVQGQDNEGVYIQGAPGFVSINAPQGIAPDDGLNLSVTSIADQNWDELIAGHLSAGSTGEALNNATAPTAGQVADAVWDEDATPHQTQGSFGQVLGDSGADADTIWALANANLDANVGSRAMPGDAMDLITNAVDANAVDTSAVTEIQAGLATSAEVAGVQSDTDDIQARLPGALTVDGLMKSDTLRVGGTLQTAGDVIGDTNDIQARLPAALTVDGNIKADTLRVGGTLQTAGDIIGDTNDIQSRLPAALTGAGNIKADALVVSDKTGYALTTTEHGLVADKLLGRNLAGGSDGGRTVQQALRLLRNLRQIVAGVLTVFREDDATSDWTASVTTTPGDPVDRIDPS